MLIVGWFSFEMMGSTAGDIIAKDVACGWLREAGYEPITAMSHPEGAGEVRTTDVDPADFDLLVFVCGPIGNGPPINEFLERFPHARKFAVDVTLLQPRADWQPFEHIVERDSAERVNPDITFAAARGDAPVVGVILVGPQDEYPTHRHDLVEGAFARVVDDLGAAAVAIDTRLDVNAGGLRNAAQVESLIAKMDAVLTTRLHGAVLALRRGVPPVAVDSVPGGSKLLAQMRRIAWPLAFDVVDLDDTALREALTFALSADGRDLAQRVAERAADDVELVRAELLDALAGVPGGVA